MAEWTPIPGRDRPPSALLFDLSEVLISGLVGVENELASLLGEPADGILPQLGGEPLRLLCRGSTSEEAYWESLRRRCGWDVDLEDLKRAVRRNFRHCVPGMPELVERLHGHIDLVLLSDHAREWIAFIEAAHPFLERFERRVYSFETGRLKDEDRTFPDVLTCIDRRGAECVFVDDNPRNVEQAERAGIRSVRFEDRRRLEHALRGFGVPIGPDV